MLPFSEMRGNSAIEPTRKAYVLHSIRAAKRTCCKADVLHSMLHTMHTYFSSIKQKKEIRANELQTSLRLSPLSPTLCASLHLKSTLVSTNKVKYFLIIFSVKNHQQSERASCEQLSTAQLTLTLYFTERISWKFSHRCFKEFHTLSTDISTLALNLGARWPKITSGNLVYTFKWVSSRKRVTSNAVLLWARIKDKPKVISWLISTL